LIPSLRLRAALSIAARQLGASLTPPLRKPAPDRAARGAGSRRPGRPARQWPSPTPPPGGTGRAPSAPQCARPLP